MPVPTGWLRVTKQRPCPVCGEERRGLNTWCLIHESGTRACCPRTPSSRRMGDAGWIHDLGAPIDARPLRMAPRAKQPDLNCRALLTRFMAAADESAVQSLASELGVSAESLSRLRTGRDLASGAWTFPMSEPDGEVIGFRLRMSDGSKRAITGSRSGLFIPLGLTGTGPLLICEGESDTAAALTLGFDAIGRPGCRNGAVQAAGYLKHNRRDEAWIIADRDAPGREGAEALAAEITPVTSVRIVAPPAAKDLRAWVRDGATKELIECVARQKRRWTEHKIEDRSAERQQQTAPAL